MFAILISGFSVLIFTHLKPFIKESDDHLAIATQASILLTLFYALLTKSGIEETEEYNRTVFGVLLVFINLLGILMVAFAALIKPANKVLRILGRKHTHNSPLRGLSKKHKPWCAFRGYFFDLAESTVETAGWEKMEAKYFGKKGKGEAWLEETGAIAEWRCSTGDGPIDQVSSAISWLEIERAANLRITGPSYLQRTLADGGSRSFCD